MSKLLERRRFFKTNRSKRMVAPFQIKQVDAGARTFVGALSSSHLDLGNGYERDIVWPGAFKRWIKSLKADDSYVPLIDSHDRWSIFNVYGVLLDAEEVLTGKDLQYPMQNNRTLTVPEMYLMTTWQIIDGADGDGALDRLRAGAIRKMSMGYEPIRSDNDTLDTGERIRNLREVRVEEGSLVVFPMNPMADVDLETVKSLLLKPDLNEKERDDLLQLYEELGTLLNVGYGNGGGATRDEPGNETAPAESVERLKTRISGLQTTRLLDRISAVRMQAAEVLL